MKEMTMKEIKACSLEALVFIDSFCKENNITWWLCGGTLLGAVRHNGFIPWDDDIDIMLPRREYERLQELFPRNGRYRLYTSDNTERFPFTYGKIADTRTVKDETIRTSFQRIGVDIDVFPIDNLPNDLEECQVYYKRIERCGLKLNGLSLNYGKGRSIMSSILKNSYIFIQRFLEKIGLVSFESIRDQMIDLSQAYNKQDTDYWGITCIHHYGIKERNHKQGYLNTIEVEFEGHHFPAPECYQKYLSQLYGKNYMQLPPIENRASTHTFKAYWT